MTNADSSRNATYVVLATFATQTVVTMSNAMLPGTRAMQREVAIPRPTVIAVVTATTVAQAV